MNLVRRGTNHCVEWLPRYIHQLNVEVVYLEESHLEHTRVVSLVSEKILYPARP